MKIENIRKHLPKGWRRAIREKTEFTVTYISYVVLGKRPCDSISAKEILSEALKLAEENKKEQEMFKRKLEQL